jgi:hypothetical protein
MNEGASTGLVDVGTRLLPSKKMANPTSPSLMLI